MVGDAAEPAGAGEGAAGLGAAPGAVFFAQDGRGEYLFSDSQSAGEVAVDLFPGAVVLDGSRSSCLPDVIVEIPD